MARLRVSLDLGSNATVAEIAGIVEDLSSAVALAVQWSQMSNRSAAISHVEQRLLNERENAVDVHLSRSGELELWNFVQLLHQWNEFQSNERDALEWLIWSYGRRSRDKEPEDPYMIRELVHLPLRRPRLEDLAPEAFALLVSEELLTRFDGPPTVESMTYENPWEIILAATSPATLYALLVLIRDWRANAQRAWASARKEEAEAREINARALGEEQKAAFIQKASAALAERPDMVLALAHLSKLLDGNGSAWDALARLAVLQPTIEELSDSDAS